MATESSSMGSDPQGSSSSTPPSIKLLFSASDDGTVKVWDLMTRQCVRTLEGHVAQVQCLKVLSIDEHSSTSFPLGTTDKEKNSYIQPSEQRKPIIGRSQVIDGNGYEGFFEDMPGRDGSAAASTSAGFVSAADVPHGPPTAASFLQAAARPPPDPSTLPYINFGEGKAPLVISGSLDK
jgi:F-box/WD-40 domain protein MET30